MTAYRETTEMREMIMELSATYGLPPMEIAEAARQLASDAIDPIVADGEEHVWRHASPPDPYARVDLIEAWDRYRRWCRGYVGGRSRGMTAYGHECVWRELIGWSEFWAVRGPTEEWRRAAAEDVHGWVAKLEAVEAAQRKRRLHLIEGGRAR